MTGRADTLGIAGAGAFGTALAHRIAGAGRPVVLWSRDPAVVREIETERTNRRPLPGVRLPAQVRATSDPAELAASAALIVIAVSSREVRARARELGDAVDGSHMLVHAIGALAEPDDQPVSAVLHAETPCLQTGVLAGPALPADLVSGGFTSMVCASHYERVSSEARRLLSTPPHLRVYTGHDLAGVELAAALAGAYTIAIGMADSLGLGIGPRAILITRAAAEASRLVTAVGGEARTFSGLAGLGNLLVRSSAEAGEGSADFLYGRELGRGDRSRERLPEGAHVALAAARLAERRKVRLPVLSAIARVVAGELAPAAAAAAAADSVALEE